MSKSTFLFFAILIFTAQFFIQPQTVHAQFPSECGMDPELFPPENPSSLINYGGRYISSTGTLRVLMIWVRFADDNETTTDWPDPAVLPQWAQRFVDTAYSPSGNYYPGTVSHYFYENSYGKMHVIGDVYYVTTDYDEDHYHQIAFNSGARAARAAIEVEVFDKLDSPPHDVDFTRYDNWTLNHSAGFTHSPGPDTILDMVWFMTRNLHDQNYPTPNGLPFGIGWATLDCNSLYKDGVLIKGYDYFFPASGIGMFADHLYRPINSSTAINGAYPVVNHVAHEMSHYLFGAGHFADYLNQGNIATRRSSSAMKSYVGGWQGDFCGYEKWRLNWLSPTTVNTSADDIVLWDLATTFDSLSYRLLRIPITGTNQFFLIENRRWMSLFESRFSRHNGSRGLLKPGILIYHIIGEDDVIAYTKVQKLDVDGRFQWRAIYHGSNPSRMTDDLIDKEYADRFNGYNESERIFIPGIGSSEYWTPFNLPDPSNPYGGGPYQGCTYFLNVNTAASDHDGDSLDLYQIGDVLTPWSNPGSHRWDFSTLTFVQTSVGLEVISFSPLSQTYTLNIRLTNPDELSPSKPQDLRVTAVTPSATSLRWARNLEPDLAKYYVYRGIFWAGSSTPTYVRIDTVFAPDTTCIDDNYEPITSELPQNIDLFHRYRITAVDNQGKESVRSDSVDAYFAYIVSATVNINWNTARVPSIVRDFRKTAVWPTAISCAYAYVPGIGYQCRDTLGNGPGYWIKFGSNQTILYGGFPINRFTIPVQSGWNLVGSITFPILASNVCSQPPHIIISPFYTYSPGYAVADTLIPGGGYWVKVSQNGSIILDRDVWLGCDEEGPNIAGMDKFTITDAEGNEQTLYVANSERDPVAAAIDGDMPPPRLTRSLTLGLKRAIASKRLIHRAVRSM